MLHLLTRYETATSKKKHPPPSTSNKPVAQPSSAASKHRPPSPTRKLHNSPTAASHVRDQPTLRSPSVSGETKVASNASKKGTLFFKYITFA